VLHGFTGDTDRWGLGNVLDELANDFRVIAMDARAHGRSGKPHELEAYGAPVLSDVLRLMDEVGLGKASLLGFSMGGEVALKLATMHPERFDRLVVGGAGMMVAGDIGHEDYLVWADRLSAVGPSGSIAKARFPGEEIPDPVRTWLDDNDAAALSAFARGMRDLVAAPAALERNTVPILLVIGEGDQFKPQADATLRAGRSVSMHVLPGRDHVGMMFDPTLVSTIREFLSR
jgi:pimeloyl-ACP methyl ester carboxylesterase